MELQTTNSQTLKDSIGKVLSEQPDKAATLDYISALLIRLAEMYTLKDFGGKNASLLSNWIMEQYKFESLNLVIEVLKSPPTTDHPVWRLTPDTIREWMAIGLDKLAERREIYIHNKKKEEARPIEVNQEGWTPERLAEWKKIIESSEGPVTKSPRMSEKEIKEEGQIRPKHPLYRPTTPEEAIVYELHHRWIKECFDKISGKPNANWISEDEWLKLQK